MILVTSISTIKYLNNNSSDAIESTHHSSTNNKGFSTDNRTIKIKIENTKYPQKLLLIIRFIRSIILEMRKRIRIILLN